MDTKISLEMLSTDSVSVKTQTVILVEGTEYALGLPHRRAFVNSAAGRKEMQAELAEPYRSAVLQMWGDKPTVKVEVENGKFTGIS